MISSTEKRLERAWRAKKSDIWLRTVEINLQKSRGCLNVRINVYKMTTIRATESMKDSLAKEVIQELTHGTEAEVTLVKEVSRQRDAILAIARTVEKITKSQNL